MPSVYFPYFRGKQFELITIRENAVAMAKHGICPIIEPVRESLSGLQRAIEALQAAGAEYVVVTNPKHGDHAEDSVPSLFDSVRGMISSNKNGHSLGLILSPSTTLSDIQSFIKESANHSISLIHYGLHDPSILDPIVTLPSVRENIFIDGYSGKLYQRQFRGSTRIMIRDGFRKRVNRDYPEEERFSDLHLTYQEEGMQGFGDFLIVGDEYSESGGPAYAVAIHLTYLDPIQFNEMMIRHFISDRTNTPIDPAGKYLEALNKLVSFADSNPNKIFESRALAEFRRSYRERHFPGLGYVKRLSMQHHLETLADFLSPGE